MYHGIINKINNAYLCCGRAASCNLTNTDCLLSNSKRFE